MTDYRKPQTQLLIDLIDDVNPGFKTTYAPEDLGFGTPASQSVPPGGIADTNTAVRGTMTGKLIGSQTVEYRRIDLSKLFRNAKVKLNDYVAGSGSLPKAQFVASLNSRYGLNLSESDVVTSSITEGTGKVISIASTSKCYSGTITLDWVRGKAEIATAISNPELAGRSYPGGNDFSQPRKPQAEFLCYGIDCSDMKTELEGLSSPATNGTGIQSFLTWLNGKLGTSYTTDAATAEPGLAGVTRTRYSLPDAALPEANSARYNRAMVFQANSDSWFQGKFIFHYNV